MILIGPVTERTCWNRQVVVGNWQSGRPPKSTTRVMKSTMDGVGKSTMLGGKSTSIQRNRQVAKPRDDFTCLCAAPLYLHLGCQGVGGDRWLAHLSHPSPARVGPVGGAARLQSRPGVSLIVRVEFGGLPVRFAQSTVAHACQRCSEIIHTHTGLNAFLTPTIFLCREYVRGRPTRK